MLYNSGFSSNKYKDKNNVLKDFLDNVVPKHMKFENGKGYEDVSSLPNVKGFHKPKPIKSYIYRMNHHKEEIKERKEKIASCYLLTLGHSLPLGHESRQYQNYYYTKTRNTFTNNYINATNSKIQQNTEFYHKYIDFDYELPTIISKLPYKTYLDYYNSDSYSPQLRRPENKKYYFVNNIPSNPKKGKSLKIPDLNDRNNSYINNKKIVFGNICDNDKYKFSNNNQNKIKSYSNNNNNNNIKNNSNINNKSILNTNRKGPKKSVRIIDNKYTNRRETKISINDINKPKTASTFEAPIIRIKKNNEKLKRIKDIDKIMNQNKVDTIYHSKYIIST